MTYKVGDLVSCDVRKFQRYGIISHIDNVEKRITVFWLTTNKEAIKCDYPSSSQDIHSFKIFERFFKVLA